MSEREGEIEANISPICYNCVNLGSDLSTKFCYAGHDRYKEYHHYRELERTLITMPSPENICLDFIPVVIKQDTKSQ